MIIEVNVRVTTRIDGHALMTSMDALSYEEPNIVTILILTSFLFLLNGINYAFDRILYCGLIGQILVGIAWGLPAADWLSQDVQYSVMQLGYLGLILIVYEGGLSTKLGTLKANLALSATVAIIGISTPIALSFILLKMLQITPLQAFAAGAALCSTSLGTTFTVLATSGLTESRLGVVLASAAMMDDVVGLIMVQVISNIGKAANFQASTVLRPIGVSLAFAICIPLICLLAKPLIRKGQGLWRKDMNIKLQAFMTSQKMFLIFHTVVLLALVTGSSYAGTSNLFAAYLAGASVTWFDELREERSNEATRAASGSGPQRRGKSNTGKADQLSSIIPRDSHAQANTSDSSATDQKDEVTGLAVYEKYYFPAVNTLLRPFFFASIGFSIPITRMFSGRIVWRGFLYTALMVLGKTVCGLCLVRFGILSVPQVLKAKSHGNKKPANQPEPATSLQQQGQTEHTTRANTAKKRTSNLPKPRSLYPAAILGSAMTSRGEVGFLISSIAQSNGIYSIDGGSSELFLVVTWAILLCTILGPVTVGLLVKHVKRLQVLERQRGTGREDPLGVWGVVGN